MVTDGQAERTEGVAQVGPRRAFWAAGPEHLRQGFAAVGPAGLGGQVGQQGAGLERFKLGEGSPSSVTSNGPSKRMARRVMWSPISLDTDRRQCGRQASHPSGPTTVYLVRCLPRSAVESAHTIIPPGWPGSNLGQNHTQITRWSHALRL